MTMERFPILRLTQDAYDQLLSVSEDTPEVYLDPDTDFGQILRSRGIAEYAENTGVYSTRPIELTPVSVGRPNLADRQALDFYHSLRGMTTSAAVDNVNDRIWAWMTHFRMHSYSIKRWPVFSRSLTSHVKKHWFVENQRDGLWDSNTASRTWWIAHTATKAAQGSGGAFTAQQALEHFANHAEHYHTLMGTGAGFTWHPDILAEFVRVLINEADGINREGVRQLWRRINLAAGTLLLDVLSRDDLRRRIVEYAESIMSNADLVSDRTKLRNQRPLRVLSLGAGVQSTVLALMAEKGEYGIPRPDIAIFADTGWEPPEVYEHLDWLESVLSFETVRVSAGNIREAILSGTNPEGREYLDIPVFLINPDGSRGIATRQCTRVYKLDPIRKYLRKRLNILPKQRAPKTVQVEMWLGISIDEVMRAKPSREEWITNRYPLIELDFSRAQLQNWFNEHYPDRYLPTSSCIGCPYHSDAVWKHLKENDSKSFQDAVFIDQALRNVPATKGTIKGEAYLHRSRTSLVEVDFSEAISYDNAMLEECEGLCGI